MKNDFLAWEKQNEEFLEHLEHHDSILYSRIYDVLRVLDFLSMLDEDSAKDIETNEDLSIIFETGYAYLYNFVNDIKLYLENYFNNDLHKLLEFEDLVNYSLYVEEIKDNLIDENKYDEIISKEFEYILSDIENKLSKQLPFTEETFNDYDNHLESVMPMDKMYKTVDEIFVEVYEALKMD